MTVAENARLAFEIAYDACVGDAGVVTERTHERALELIGSQYLAEVFKALNAPFNQYPVYPTYIPPYANGTLTITNNSGDSLGPGSLIPR